MAYLVVIVDQSLPVIVPIHVPGMVEGVIIHIEVIKSGLLVGTLEIGLPWHWRFIAVNVDPYKASMVNIDVNLEQTIAIRVESIHILKPRSFCEFTTETV